MLKSTFLNWTYYNKSGLNYINSKYKELLKTKNYKLITKIQKKYNIEQQQELVFKYC